MNGLISKIIKLIFPGIFPLYGGGGSGGGTKTTTNESKKGDPWAPAIPYVKQGFSEAQRLYTLGPQQYTPWSQVASFDPQQLAAMQGIREYINAPGTQAQLSQGNQLVSNLLSGGDNVQSNLGKQYAGNLAGYLQNANQADVADSLNRFMYQNMNDPSLVQNVNRAVGQAATNFNPETLGVQNRMGVGQRALSQYTAPLQQSAINRMFSSAYDTQEAARQQAINTANALQANRAGTIADLISSGDRYGTAARELGLNYQGQMLNMPLQYLNVLSDIGGRQQAQQQAMLNEATNRWNFNQNAPYQALLNYRNLINPNSAWGQTDSTSTGTTMLPGVPKPNTAASVGGGALSGAAAGSAILPGWGTVIGGLLGAGAGYLGSR